MPQFFLLRMLTAISVFHVLPLKAVLARKTSRPSGVFPKILGSFYIKINLTHAPRATIGQLQGGLSVKRFIVAFSCLVASAFAFQNAVPETTSGITIQGAVLQAPGGQPIRKANVQFRASRGQSNRQYSATTDPDGWFKIDDLKPGRYMVTLEHPGFVQAGRGGRSTSLLLQPGQGTSDLVFHMDTGQKFDWTQLHVFLAPLDERDSGIAFSGSFELPGLAA